MMISSLSHPGGPDRAEPELRGRQRAGAGAQPHLRALLPPLLQLQVERPQPEGLRHPQQHRLGDRAAGQGRELRHRRTPLDPHVSGNLNYS